MKHEQVVVDYFTFFKTSGTYLLLAFLGLIFIRLLQAVFWLPSYLDKKQKQLERDLIDKMLLTNDDEEVPSIQKVEEEPKKDK